MASLLDLFVKISANDEASEKIDSFAQKATTKFKSIGSSIGAVGKAVGAGIAAASAGAAFLTKAAVDSYGDYEQLVGGVETLFKDSADIVMGYAESAYKTSGVSANQYMETVTSFSASLLQSLGGDTAKAADKANLALTDMSDNANKMGTAMESIQNAYQGFAKQNFTMLDNLKIGYGGTKQEMERLLKDAEKLSGVKYDISSYADMVDAIHVVQTEMGITGTTALEAATTIQGSVNSMKAAWENWVTGLGDSKANMEALTSTLLTTVETAAGNILPVATNALTAITNTIATSAPEIINSAFGFITDNLPAVTNAGMNLVIGLVNGIVNNLPAIASAGIDIVLQLANGVVSAIPQLIGKVPELITGIVNMIRDKIPEIQAAGAEIIESLQAAFNNAGIDIDLSAIIEKIQSILPVVEAAIAAVVAFKAAMAFQDVIEAVKGVSVAFKALNAVLVANPFATTVAAIAAVVTILITLWNTNEGFRNAVISAWEAIQATASAVATAIGNFFTAAWDAIKSVWASAEPYFSSIWSSIQTIFSVVSGWFGAIFSAAWDAIKGIWAAVEPYFAALWAGIQGVFSAVSSWLPGIWSAAWAAIQGVWNGVLGYFDAIWAGIAGIFSAADAVLHGDFQAAWESIKGVIDKWADYFGAVWDSICAVFANAVSVGSQIVNDIKSGIAAAWDGIVSWFNGLWDSLFGGRNVNVGVTTSGSGGGRAIGLDYVPYNGMPAVLHRGEAVLTAAEADEWRRGAATANQPVLAQTTVYQGYDSEVISILGQILDSMGDNLSRDIKSSGRGMTQRDFNRAVRSVG